MWPDQQGISLDDIDFCLKECRAHSKQWLRALWQFDTDQIGFDNGQPCALQNFSTLLGMIDLPDEANYLDQASGIDVLRATEQRAILSQTSLRLAKQTLAPRSIDSVP